MAECDIDPVGPTEIAARLHAPINTVHSWIHHRLLPPERWRVGQGPIWDWSDIETWAIATGRLAASAHTQRQRCQDTPELVGTSEIAERLHVTKRSVQRRVQQGQMAPPKWQVSGRGVWLWEELKGFPSNLNSRSTSR